MCTAFPGSTAQGAGPEYPKEPMQSQLAAVMLKGWTWEIHSTGETFAHF